MTQTAAQTAAQTADQTAAQSRALITAYYAAFNAENPAGMLACVADDLEHRVNESASRFGRAKFAEFCAHMGVSYRESLQDIEIFTNAAGTRAAAEFIVQGEYLKTDPSFSLDSGLPEAKGQRYTLPAGAFFDIKNNQITRITTFYNLADWTLQVSR